MITHGLWFLQAQHKVLTTKDWTGDMGIRIQEFLHFAFLYDMIRHQWFHFFPYILSPSHHSLPLAHSHSWSHEHASSCSPASSSTTNMPSVSTLLGQAIVVEKLHALLQLLL